jgi:hypothetical protein
MSIVENLKYETEKLLTAFTKIARNAALKKILRAIE